MIKSITLKFDVEVPDETSDHEIESWVLFEIGAKCDLRASPVSSYDLLPIGARVELD